MNSKAISKALVLCIIAFVVCITGCKTSNTFKKKQPVSFVDNTSVLIKPNAVTFENNVIAYTSHAGGLGVNIFGKTKHAAKKGLLLPLISDASNPLIENPYEYSRWGLFLQPLKSPDLGAVYIYAPGGEVYLPQFEGTKWKLAADEPDRLIIAASAPVIMPAGTVQVNRTFVLLADERSLYDQVMLTTQNNIDLRTLRIGLTLPRLEGEFVNKPGLGFAYSTGTDPDRGIREMGLGIIYDPRGYIDTRTIEQPDKITMILLKPVATQQGVHIKSRITGFWNGDPLVNSAKQFDLMLRSEVEPE